MGSSWQNGRKALTALSYANQETIRELGSGVESHGARGTAQTIRACSFVSAVLKILNK